MYDDVRSLVSRQLPSYEIRTLIRLGEGLDNVGYEINDELLVRLNKDAGLSDRAAREAELLRAVAAVSTLPVPQPVFADHGARGYLKVPGVPLLEHRVADPTRLAVPLGDFLTHLHAAPLSALGSLVPLEADPLLVWRDEAERDYLDLMSRDVAAVPARGRQLVEDFLARTPPPEPHPDAAVFCHCDLGAEHLLVDPTRDEFSGVIDWTDAAIADPVVDLGRIYRDLGPAVFELVVASYGRTVDGPARERARFYAGCALIGDLAYGRRTGDRRYSDAALANLNRTFAA